MRSTDRDVDLDSGVRDADELEAAFGVAIARLGVPLLSGLNALEQAFRRLHPPRFPAWSERLRSPHEALEQALEAFGQTETPPLLREFRDDLEAAARLARDALSRLVEAGALAGAAPHVLEAMHLHARAQARLYPLRTTLAPVSAFFAEPFQRETLEALEPAGPTQAEVGLFRRGDVGARGGFDLYVPESDDGREPWPLIVALHGGSGHGADDLSYAYPREENARLIEWLDPRRAAFESSTP